VSAGETEVRARPVRDPAGAAVVASSPWRIAWRRFRRDRVAVASGVFLIVLLLAVFPGAKIASVALGHVGICVYIEAVFRMPGLGYETLRSLGGLGIDLPVLIAITAFTGTMIIVLNLLVDIVAVILDPRIRRSPRAGRGAFGLASRLT